MAKYQIWDKKSDIYTYLPSPKSGKMHWTAEEYIREEAPWAGLKEAKVIIGTGPVNGSIFLDFYERIEFYKKQGLKITENMTDSDILAMIEEYESYL